MNKTEYLHLFIGLGTLIALTYSSYTFALSRYDCVVRRSAVPHWNYDDQGNHVSLAYDLVYEYKTCKNGEKTITHYLFKDKKRIEIESHVIQVGNDTIDLDFKRGKPI
jgi:hypothetical protein